MRILAARGRFDFERKRKIYEIFIDFDMAGELSFKILGPEDLINRCDECIN